MCGAQNFLFFRPCEKVALCFWRGVEPTKPPHFKKPKGGVTTQ